MHAAWQAETGKKPIVGLSATRDVQDAILADPARAAAVNVIDLRYWWYTAAGTAYAPPGGQNLAPRQQLREAKGGSKTSDVQAARAVAEYRRRFPEKAVLCSTDGANGWATLAAGGSLPNLRGADAALLAAAARLKPVPVTTEPNQWALGEPGRGYLVYSASGAGVRLDLADGNYTARRIDPRTGRRTGDSFTVRGGGSAETAASGDGPWVLWLTRD
ncbi:MAG: DUF6298 domain-containing protein [Gemmataceae bacterium]